MKKLTNKMKNLSGAISKDTLKRLERIEQAANSGCAKEFADEAWDFLSIDQKEVVASSIIEETIDGTWQKTGFRQWEQTRIYNKMFLTFDTRKNVTIEIKSEKITLLFDRRFLVWDSSTQAHRMVTEDELAEKVSHYHQRLQQEKSFVFKMKEHLENKVVKRKYFQVVGILVLLPIYYFFHLKNLKGSTIRGLNKALGRALQMRFDYADEKEKNEKDRGYIEKVSLEQCQMMNDANLLIQKLDGKGLRCHKPVVAPI